MMEIYIEDQLFKSEFDANGYIKSVVYHYNSLEKKKKNDLQSYRKETKLLKN